MATGTDINGQTANKGGWWKRLAIVAIGSMFGPVGSAIAGAVVAWGEGRGWFNKGGTGPSQWALDKLTEWEENYFANHYEKILKATRGPLGQVTSALNINLINNLLAEAYAWQAYYEQVSIRSTDEDEVELSTLKADTIAQVMLVVRYKWLETVQGLSWYPENFDPTTYKNISGDTLNWQGAKVSAEKFYIAEQPHGGLPPGGGTGGGTTNPPTGGTGGGTTNPPTGGSGNGGTKPPVLPPTTQRPIEYFRLSMEEKYIYLDWEKTGNTNFYEKYRRENPSYKPSPELLKLLGIKDTGSGTTAPTGPNPNNPWNYLPTTPKKNNTLMIVAFALGAAFLIRRSKTI